MSKKQKKISVIVPIYNVAEYLETCITSIIEQTYKNIEIILVDDGSTDDCGEICDRWGEKDSRIVVVHKENGGLADARNAGLKVAKGDYIGFVDSDDWIHPEMYERMLEAIENNNCKVAMTRFETKYNANEPDSGEYTNSTFLMSGHDIVNSIVFKEGKIPITYSVWKFLYDYRLVEKKEFPYGRYYEDVIYSVTTLWSQEKVVIVDAPLYYYRLRANSITGVQIKQKHVSDMLVYADFLLDFYRQNGTSEENRKARVFVIDEMVNYLIKIYENSKTNNKEIINYMKNKNLGLLDLAPYPKKMVKYIMQMICPKTMNRIAR